MTRVGNCQAELRKLFLNNFGIESSLFHSTGTPSTKAAVWKRQPAVRPLLVADQPSEFVILCIATIMVGQPPQRGGDNVQQRTGRAGTNGEGGSLRREPVVTLLESHPRSTKPTGGGSAFAPTKSPNILASHTCRQTRLSTLTSPLSVRTVCGPRV